MITILTFIVLGLNLVNLFLDMPMWYAIMVGSLTIITAILVIKNSTIIKRLIQKKK